MPGARPMPVVRGLLVVPWILLGMACSSADRPARPSPEETAEAGGLLEVPHPDLSAFDGSVQSQLRDGRAALEAALARTESDPADLSRAFGQAGRLYQAYSLRDAAEICYLNAQQLAPTEFRWPYFLAHLYHDRGSPELAMASIERALALRSDYVPALILAAQIHYDQNRLEPADALYRNALTLDPACAAALLGLGRIASSRREYAAAVEHLEAALRLAPDASEIHYPLGVAYRGLGEQEKAAEYLEQRGMRRAEVPDPVMNEVRVLTGGVQFFQNRGSQYFEEGQYDLARAEFEKAIEAAPDDPGPHTNLGLTLALLDDSEGARRELETALRLDPENVAAHYNLGELLTRRGDDPGAVEQFRAALAGNPDHVQAHLGLGNALRRLARFEEAAEHYRRVVESDPGNPVARITEALTLIRLHRYADARRRLEEAREVFPEDPAILNALARVLAAAPDDSVRDAQEAVRIGHKLVRQQLSLDSAVTLAMIAANNGEFEPAMTLQRQAIEWARRLGREQKQRALQVDLERYGRNLPSRTPWPDDDPALAPPPLAATAPTKP